MKAGLAILPKLPLPEFIGLGQKCEQNGLSLWVPDERFFRDVFVSLSALAAHTRTSTLGTGATDPFIRHPLLTAAAMATLDELSGGRAILGIGAGISGFDALGIKRMSPAKAVRDAIELSRRFWAGESVTSSSFAFAKSAMLGFKSREIPIFVTGRGPMILALGGEIADGVIIGHFTSDRGLGFAQGHIDTGLKKRSPDRKRPETVVWAYTSVSKDGDAARAAVKPAIGRTIASTREALEILGEDGTKLLQEIDRFGYSRSAEYDQAMRDSVSDSLTTHLSISGTPEECLDRIRAIGACGVDQVILLPYPPAGVSIPEMAELIFTDLLPKIPDL
jgi:5,10-methylenetetrahydromethanopterin reductase